MKQRICQIITTLLYNSYFKGFFLATIYQGKFKFITCPGFNCYSCPSAILACPIGIIQQFVAYGPYYVSFYTFGILGTIGAVGGRIVCGWACPFGFLQDMLYKIKLPKIEIAGFLHSGKYFILIFLVFVIPYYTKEPWFSKLCPQGTLEAGIPLVLINAELRQLIGSFFALKLSILIFFIIWMMGSKRPFCRTTCPLGAIYSLFNKISFYRLTVNEGRCIKCNQCYDNCPVSLKIYEQGDTSTNCIRCLRCTKCPSKAVKYTSKLIQ